MTNKELKKDLTEILDYFSILDELDVKKTSEPFYPFEIFNVFRKDKAEAASNETRREIINQFPQEEEKKLKVKGIL